MRSFATALAAALCAVLLVIGIPACATGARPPSKFGKEYTDLAPTKGESGALVSGHAAKDKTVVGAAAAIDQTVAGTAQAPAVKAQTDGIRDAVAAAPAEQIAEILARFDRAIAGWEQLAKDQAATITAQAEQIAALKDAELRAQVRAIRLAGLVCLGVAALLGFVAKNIPGAGVAAGLGFLAFSIAQAWLRVASHPAFIPAVVCAIVAGLGGLTWACVHAYRKGDLAKKTEREAARLKETLGAIVPAIDQAKDALDAAGQKTLIAALRGVMDAAHKKVIHEVRASI